MNEESSVIADSSTFIGLYPASSASVLTGAVYKRKASTVWNYIQSKISLVLGLTATQYNGNAKTATNAVSANTAITATNATNAERATIAGTADKTVNDISITVPFAKESGQYVIPFGNILEPTSTATDSPYNWDITGFFSIIRPNGHNGSHLWFEAGHGFSHEWTTYAYLDSEDFSNVTSSIKAFQYNGKWWLGLCLTTRNQDYYSKMTVTYRKGLPATPTCILYSSKSDGIINEEIYNSIQDIPSSWWKTRTIHNPTTFTRNITAPVIQATDNFIGNLTGNATDAYNAYRGMVHTCSTVAGTASKTVSIPGFTLTTGACIRVLFANGNSIAKPTLNVNNTGAKEIVVPNINNGSVKTLSSDSGSTTTGVYSWQSNTVLELYYNGSYWVVMNNPVVRESISAKQYKLYINGWKEMVVGGSDSTSGSLTVTLPISFSTSSFFAIASAYGSEKGNPLVVEKKNMNSVVINRVSDPCTSWQIYAQGY